MESFDHPVVLVVGANSKVAEALSRVFRGNGRKNIIFASTESEPPKYYGNEFQFITLDLNSRKDIKHVCFSKQPQFIINTTAFTNVDLCETERKKAWTVNVSFVENLVNVCRLIDSHLIHFSTDYIFDGNSGPYTETSTPNPLSYYGKTKLASENICLTGNISCSIIRTNVLYGATLKLKPDFVLWVLNRLKEQKPFFVVNDQFSNPTLTDDIALLIEKLLVIPKSGIFHTGGQDWISRYQFAQIIARVFKFDQSLVGEIKTTDLHQPATRPLKAGLITLSTETSLGVKFCSVENGLLTMRRQLQSMGHYQWNH